MPEKEQRNIMESVRKNDSPVYKPVEVEKG